MEGESSPVGKAGQQSEFCHAGVQRFREGLRLVSLPDRPLNLLPRVLHQRPRPSFAEAPAVFLPKSFPNLPNARTTFVHSALGGAVEAAQARRASGLPAYLGDLPKPFR